MITQFICHCSNYWAYMLPCRYKRYNKRNLNKKGWTSHKNFIMNLLFTKEENSGIFGLSDLHSPFQHLGHHPHSVCMCDEGVCVWLGFMYVCVCVCVWWVSVCVCNGTPCYKQLLWPTFHQNFNSINQNDTWTIFRRYNYIISIVNCDIIYKQLEA